LEAVSGVKQSPAKPTAEPAAKPTAEPAAKPTAKPPTPEAPLKDPLFQRLRELLREVEKITGHEVAQLGDSLEGSDQILTSLRAESRAALKEASRQVRIRDCRSPDIVLFLLDDVGYGDLACRCQERICAPCINAVADCGTRFTQFYAGSGWSTPSRGTLLSGNSTSRGQLVDGELVTVKESDFTLAETLYQGGYETALFGVWDVGPMEIAGHPNSQGFEYFFGYLDGEEAKNYYPESLWRNGEQVLLPENQGGARRQYAPDLIVSDVVHYLHHTPRRPFFLTIALPMTLIGDGTEVPDFGPYAECDWPVPNKAKAAMLTRVDCYVGQILCQLKTTGRWTNTMVIVTSDNGPDDRCGVDLAFFNSTAGLRGRKGDLYEGGIRVPMIVHWPQAPWDAAACDFPWAMWDVLPTLVQVTGTWRGPQGIDGVSLIERLKRSTDPGLPPCCPALYWEKHGEGFAQAARLGEWKSVRFAPDGPWELYNLCTDVAESQNVAGQHPEVLAEIDKLIHLIKPLRAEPPD
jgi:arylsulfatase A-like enzyme